MLKKNEYSKAVYFSSPRNIPVIVVIPDLEVPGIKAIVWERPIIRACFQDIFSISSIFLSLFLVNLFSTKIKTIPQKIREIARIHSA